ncbi:hypothetical protein L1887_05601 [Cichorium endivia]|nr:hypothetical protein L1887_05601 [Cichorium endivia]
MKTLSGRSDDLPAMSIETIEDRRLSTSSRRLSLEMAMHQTSVEVYYGGAPVGVPFKWESQPGTPRVRFHETPLPPLTPPPSFLFNSPNTSNKKNSKPKGGILHAVLPRLTLTRKPHNTPASPASSESSSLFSTWSYSDSASSLYNREGRRKSFEDHDRSKSPVSTLCFRIRRGAK